MFRLVRVLVDVRFVDHALTHEYCIGPHTFEVGQRNTNSHPLYNIAGKETLQ